MLSEFSTIDVFVLLMVVCAVLVALWTICAVLERYRITRVTAVLAAISGILLAFLYVSMWGFTLPA